MSATRSPKRLKRVLKVRALQLDIARADEARAREAKDSAEALRDRIRALGDEVAPAAGAASGLGLIAAAHYRGRLHRSGEEALRRVAQADSRLDAARAATGAARRDHGAVEKLVERALAAEAAAAIRSLHDAPPVSGKLARTLLKQG